MQQLQPNTTLQGGKYRIERVLGQGGFGNTYVGYNTEFEETVAIKEFFMKGVTERDETTHAISVSNSDNIDQFNEQREKFKKEAQRIRKLDNSHIVKVHDLFEENGTAYYVMDFVEGENLAQRMKRTGKPMSEKIVREILPQLLDALKAVHDAGMWHLDLKPANIMLDKAGNVKLIDFGASKQLNTQKGGATTSTAVSYTNGYAPREQMEQNYDKFGPWTDIYALGATLYNLLTKNRPPMPSDIDDDISVDKHNALPFPVSTSADMKQLVLKMMQTNRMHRPQSIDELITFMLSDNPEKAGDDEATILSTSSVDSGEETIIEPKVEKPAEQQNENKEEESTDIDFSYLDELTWKDKFRNFWGNLKSVIIIVSCLSATSIIGICVKTCDRLTGWGDKHEVASDSFAVSKVDPQSVDLGLSVEWASFNVGARNPYEFGDYYWWASANPLKSERDTLNIYDWNADKQSFEKYNSVGMLMAPEDDAAMKEWGDEWRTPTPDELYELTTECTWEEAEYMNTKGYNVIGKNGNKIFLPYVFNPDGSYYFGSYLSNRMSPNNVAYFYSLIFSDKSLKDIGLLDENLKECVMELDRSYIGVIRPVKNRKSQTTEVSLNEKNSVFVRELLKDFIYMDKGTIFNKTIKPFWISKILVSQKLWKEIMGNNPSSTKSETAPVDKISWYECQEFIEKLNQKTGLSFRMPTSDEWAYASTRGIQGKIGEWTTSPHCYSDNNGYGRYSITRILPYTNYTEATRALTIKENELGLRLALDKR